MLLCLPFVPYRLRNLLLLKVLHTLKALVAFANSIRDFCPGL